MKYGIKLLFASIFIMCAYPSVYASSDNRNSANEKMIQALLKENKIPGAAVAIVNQNGIVWARGFGVKNQKNTQPVDTQTLFSIESQTKMFTALGVMRGVQSGMFSLEEPIRTYLPNFIAYSPFEKNPAEKITLTHLLSHTAGFAHEAPIGNNFNSNASFEDHIHSILEGTWLQFPVGKGYNYSNAGIDLAGYILQMKSEEPFSTYMEKEVLTPLQMFHTTFDPEKFISSPNHADGTIEGIDPTPLNYSIIPAGGMYASLEDMSHYLEFQLNNGNYQGQHFINESLLKKMLTIPFPYPHQTEGNALGIWKAYRNHTLYFSHLGRGFGFASDLEWYPQYHIGVVVLMNKYDPNNTDIKIAHLLVDQYLPNETINAAPKLKTQKNPDIALEKQMIGEYISNSASINIVEDPDTQGIAISGLLNSGPAGNNIQKVFLPLQYIGKKTFYSPKSKEYYIFETRGITGVKTLRRVNDAYMWFYNQSAHDPVGPNLSSWTTKEGAYDLQGYGPTIHFHVAIKNGYLYLDHDKLRQITPQVFIAANGEALVLNGKKALWGNLPLNKE